MIVQGERPWEGRSELGSWQEVEPLWDGTAQWKYVPYRRSALAAWGEVLAEIMAPALRGELNRQSTLLEELRA